MAQQSQAQEPREIVQICKEELREAVHRCVLRNADTAREYLLELAFPRRRNVYQPQAPPESRKASAEQWRRYLQAQVRGSAQQQQKAGPTRGAATNRAARQNQQPNRAINPRRPAQNRAE